MVIRPAIQADVNALAAIHGEGFERSWPAAEIKAYIENDTDDVLVALDTHIDGFVILRTIGADSEILTIAVRGLARNTGVGRALIKAATQQARLRKSETVFLEVGADNPNAICLYESAGFRRFGTRPGYYKREGGRVDAYLFQMRIRATPP